MNKASGGDGIPAELFQILKDDAVKVLNSIYEEIWKIQQLPQDWKRSVFISIPKKGNAKEYSNYCTIHFTHQQSNAQNSPSQASTVLKLRTSRCSSWIQKGRRARDQIANIRWIIEKSREFQKNIYFCFIDYTNAFDCVDHNWKVLKEMGILYYLMCHMRNLYAGQEATVRTIHRIMDWFQIGKGVCPDCILSTCLFNILKLK